MIVYRVKYSIDAIGDVFRYTKEYEDIAQVKKKAKEMARYTNRPVAVEWSYKNSGFWSLLRSCPNEKDINNVKERK